MSKTKLSFLIILFILLAVPSWMAYAQEEQAVTLRLRRDFGYGGMGEIQGTFSLIADAPESTVKVVFFINQETIGEVTQAPFKLQFNTDNYPLGENELYAVAHTIDGQEIVSNIIRITFVTAEQGWQAAGKIVIPLLVVIGGVMLLAFLITYLNTRKRGVPEPGAQRNYGFSGGAICPKCSRPTPMHLFGLNLLGSKFDRCDNCGKWSMMSRKSMDDLRRAEAEELAQMAEGGTIPPALSPEEKLRKELDDSRFQDM